jgi:DegV family protein with EDD domain
MTVGVVTDSASDLSTDEAASLGVTVVPLTVRFGDTVLVDRAGPDRVRFHQLLAEGRHHPQTASPAPGDFVTAFNHDRGHDEIVCITMPGALSGTHDAARIAARLVEAQAGGPRVHVVDGRSVSRGLGTVVAHAARTAADGASAAAVLAEAARVSSAVQTFAMLDDLDHVARGGRIGPAAARVGTMLSVKPVIGLRDGNLDVVARPRTRARARSWLATRVASIDGVTDLEVFHSGAADADVTQLVDQLQRLSPTPLSVHDVGAVIASHSGPGMVGVSWMPATTTVDVP